MELDAADFVILAQEFVAMHRTPEWAAAHPDIRVHIAQRRQTAIILYDIVGTPFHIQIWTWDKLSGGTTLANFVMPGHRQLMSEARTPADFFAALGTICADLAERNK